MAYLSSWHAGAVSSHTRNVVCKCCLSKAGGVVNPSEAKRRLVTPPKYLPGLLLLWLHHVAFSLILSGIFY